MTDAPDPSSRERPDPDDREQDAESSESDRRSTERHSDLPFTSGSHIDGPQPDPHGVESLTGGAPMVEAVDPHNERVETTAQGTSPGNSATVAAQTQRPAPEIGDADQAASRESRRLAAAQDTEQ